MFGHDAILVVDQYERYRTTSERGQRTDARREAQELSILPRPLGRNIQRIAIVSEKDKDGFDAYAQANFETIAMNGNRSAEVARFITELQSTMNTAPPKYLILMTTDIQFLPLCDSALANPKIELGVWAPAADVPPELTAPQYNFRALEELLLDSRVQNAVIFLDYENLHIGLLQEGWSPDPLDLIAKLKSGLTDLGNIAHIYAYADWDSLPRSGDRNLQRTLTKLGVRTRYQVNVKGKNTADMEMADDIRSLLERDDHSSDYPDILILGTRDRDFRRTLENAKGRGKRVVLLTLHNGLSNELRRLAGDDIRYLDDILALPNKCQIEPAAASADAAMIDLVLKTELWLRQQGREWTHADELLAAVAPEPDGPGLLDKAITAGALARSQHLYDAMGAEETLRLVAEHPIVASVRHMIDWLPARIALCLHVKQLPWVDTKYLANGMQMDSTCRRLNIGQNRKDAQQWLNRLADTGVVVRRVMPHPQTPKTLIATWWLPDRDGQISSKTGTKTHQHGQEHGASLSLSWNPHPYKPKSQRSQLDSPDAATVHEESVSSKWHRPAPVQSAKDAFGPGDRSSA